MLGKIIALFSRSGIQLLAIAGVVIGVLAKVFSAGERRERSRRNEELLERLQQRNKALENINSMSDDDVDNELHKYANNRDNR